MFVKRTRKSLSRMIIGLCLCGAVTACRQEQIPPPAREREALRPVASEAQRQESLRDEIKAVVRDHYTIERPGRRPVKGDPLKLGGNGKVQKFAIEVHKLTRKTSGAVPYDVKAMINSFQPYARLGLGNGANYLVLLNDGGAPLYMVVPKDDDFPIRLLQPSRAELVHGVTDPPHLVEETYPAAGKSVEEFTIGGCIEGPCTSGHCSVSDAERSDLAKLIRLIRRDPPR